MNILTNISRIKCKCQYQSNSKLSVEMLLLLSAGLGFWQYSDIPPVPSADLWDF